VVCNHEGQLVFLSCYGRDTALQQMFAAFSLPPSSGGLRVISLTEAGRQDAVDGDTTQYTAFVSDRLTKIAGRFPKQNLFGNLVHAWIYDPVVQQPDLANRTAWMLWDLQDDVGLDITTAIRQRLSHGWRMVQRLSPVPLLDHWEDTLLTEAQGLIQDMASSSFPPVGNVGAMRISVPESFVEIVSTLVRTGQLQLEPAATTTTRTERRAA
jgi:hypothetical protein